MIRRIIQFSADNRFVVILAVLLSSVAGYYAMRSVRVDAMPDVGDTQVIIYSRWDRSPDQIENQLTYPIVTALLGSPKVKTVRGLSDFGYSYVYVIFEDGTDPYWARTRTLEYLSTVQSSLPTDARTSLGPDATGLGWVFQYALTSSNPTYSLQDLRALQDWNIRYRLKSVPGVAEVASIGGFDKQYQVNVDPNRLRAYGVPLQRVVEAVRGGNSEASGRLLEFGGTEYMIRARGYVKSLNDIENVVVRATDDGTAIRIRDIGTVVIGPDLRRGVSDLDGHGEAVSGIVVMRQGENALDVIHGVQKRLEEIKAGLPDGVSIQPVYDRSALIDRSISNLKWTLLEVMLTVVLVIILFLRHGPSALVPIITLPAAVLISFIPFQMLGLTANVMSLAGIAIAVGALVDGAVVVVEQTHKKLEGWERGGRRGGYLAVILSAIQEVGNPSFFALLVIGISFVPVLALEGQDGRMFKPLALTKIIVMLVAAVLAITLDPALRLTLTRIHPFEFRPAWLAKIVSAIFAGRVRPEEDYFISRWLLRVYQPVCGWCLDHKRIVLGVAGAMILSIIPIYMTMGSEFMPPFDEGALFYMPSTLPGISIAEAQKLLQVTNRVIRQFPEVDRVLGKAGRAETATDPAPLSMLETLVTLKPREQWRRVPTWYSRWAPEWIKPVFRRVTPDSISPDELIAQMNAALAVPGLSNAWTMPVRGRIDMLSTGIRTPVGLKIQGESPEQIEEIGNQIASTLRGLSGVRSAFAERTGQGYYLDFIWKREELARYGLSIESAQQAVSSALGGENVTTTVEGRARYPVNVRYQRDFRSDEDSLRRALVPVGAGTLQVPLSELALLKVSSGPSMLRDEDGLLTGYVYLDIAGRDAGGLIHEARQLLGQKLRLPAGYTIRWSGQYESMERTRQRLAVLLPATLALVSLLLYLNTRSSIQTLIVLLAVPFSAIGVFWFLWLLGYNLSVAVWVGILALLGVDAETGVFMLLYLDLAYNRAKERGRMNNRADLYQAIYEGAVKRVRPKFMTVSIMLVGLGPVMWSTGAGADIMRRIAAPMIGGIVASFLLELLIYPVVYAIWKWNADVSTKVHRAALASVDLESLSAAGS